MTDSNIRQPFNFSISHSGDFSSKFKEKGVNDFIGAAVFIKQLPFRRNANKDRLLSVFDDGCGTCSTKHAVLMKLMQENGYRQARLMLGIFKMNPVNTPAVKETLEKNGLSYIPEAHCYLKIGDKILDCTGPLWNEKNFESDLLDESEIMPEQITAYKVTKHKNFIDNWLKTEAIPYSLDKLWEIRENCIMDLSKKTQNDE